MIIKSFELEKVNISQFKLFLIYGKNEGLQTQIVNNYFTKNFDGQVDKYDENQFIINFETITTGLMNRSFLKTKILIISRVTDKVINLIEEISNKDFLDVKIILKSGLLEKKSKLRSF